MSENFVQRAFAFIAIVIVICAVVLAITCCFMSSAPASLASEPWYTAASGFNWSKLLFFGGAITNHWLAAVAWVAVAIIVYALGSMLAPETMSKYGARFSRAVAKGLNSVAAAVKSTLSAVASAIPGWIWIAGGVVLAIWLFKGSGQTSENKPTKIEIDAKASPPSEPLSPEEIERLELGGA